MTTRGQEPLPRAFCWTRMGTEAGETLDHILERKERERRATGGIFLWGIGNGVGAAISELVRRCDMPEVLFSPTKSRPRPVDVKPDRLVVWTSGTTAADDRYRLPRGTRVMGGLVEGRRLQPRFALVCASDDVLCPSDLGHLRFTDLRNLISGRPVGASQVTAVVQRSGGTSFDLDSGKGRGVGVYPVSIRARLVHPYFVRLQDPVVVTDSQATFDWLGEVVA